MTAHDVARDWLEFRVLVFEHDHELADIDAAVESLAERIEKYAERHTLAVLENVKQDFLQTLVFWGLPKEENSKERDQ